MGEKNPVLWTLVSLLANTILSFLEVWYLVFKSTEVIVPLGAKSLLQIFKELNQLFPNLRR